MPVGGFKCDICEQFIMGGAHYCEGKPHPWKGNHYVRESVTVPIEDLFPNGDSSPMTESERETIRVMTKRIKNLEKARNDMMAECTDWMRECLAMRILLQSMDGGIERMNEAFESGMLKFKPIDMSR